MSSPSLFEGQMNNLTRIIMDFFLVDFLQLQIGLKVRGEHYRVATIIDYIN